jgi:bacterioferritin-associated ferredoxin
MYACNCRAITEDDVRRAGRRGVTDPEDLIALLGLDDARCCGRCERNVQQFVALAWEGAIQFDGDSPERPLVVASSHALSERSRAPSTAAGVEIALVRELAAPRRGRA